jgi:hypothetical protein
MYFDVSPNKRKLCSEVLNGLRASEALGTICVFNMEALDRPYWTSKTTTFVCDDTGLTPVSAEEVVIGGLRQIMEGIKKLQPPEDQPIKVIGEPGNKMLALAPEAEPPGEYMTTAEVSAYIKKHPNTIRRWCREGTFPFSVMPGKEGRPGARIFSKSMVDLWMKQRSFNVPTG